MWSRKFSPLPFFPTEKKEGRENASVFKVAKFEDINNKIIPLFKSYPIFGVKQLDYQDFCSIAKLISEGEHLKHQGLFNIKLIKDRMNTKRK